MSILGLKGLSNKDGNRSENVTQEKRTRADSNFITLMPTLLICQMLVIFSGAEFYRTVSKFAKRRKSLSSVHVLHKT